MPAMCTGGELEQFQAPAVEHNAMGEAAQVDELETNPEHALKPGDDVYILPLK